VSSPKTEKLAQDLRGYIRKRAGLTANWESASDDMKNFYREHARRMLAEDA
jgi:hypothetical protein